MVELVRCKINNILQFYKLITQGTLVQIYESKTVIQGHSDLRREIGDGNAVLRVVVDYAFIP